MSDTARMTDPYSNPTAASWPRWVIPAIIAAVLSLTAAAALAVWLFWPSNNLTVNGDITVTSDRSVVDVGTTCHTTGGFTDIAPGAQVVIKDATGKVVATTTLGTGVGAPDSCTFPFRVDVPAGSEFYGVELGRRGVVTYTAEQLKGGVHLTIGG